MATSTDSELEKRPSPKIADTAPPIVTYKTCPHGGYSPGLSIQNTGSLLQILTEEDRIHLKSLFGLWIDEHGLQQHRLELSMLQLL